MRVGTIVVVLTPVNTFFAKKVWPLFAAGCKFLDTCKCLFGPGEEGGRFFVSRRGLSDSAGGLLVVKPRR